MGSPGENGRNGAKGDKVLILFNVVFVHYCYPLWRDDSVGLNPLLTPCSVARTHRDRD